MTSRKFIAPEGQTKNVGKLFLACLRKKMTRISIVVAEFAFGTHTRETQNKDRILCTDLFTRLFLRKNYNFDGEKRNFIARKNEKRAEKRRRRKKNYIRTI